MTKEKINLMLINGLKAKGHNIGNISMELLNDVAVIFQKQLELTAVGCQREQLKCLMESDEPNCKCSLDHCEKGGW